MIDFDFINPAVSAKLCLTLLHTLWQVAVLAVLARIIERFWRQQSVERSYTLHVVTLCVAIIAVPVTYLLVDVPGVATGTLQEIPAADSESSASDPSTIVTRATH